MTDLNRNSRFRIVAIAGAAAVLFVVAQPVRAEDFVNTGYFGDVAIKGYDPVAYFTQNEAVEGSAKYSHHWLGATWHFASAENRDLFIKEPAKYAPQYGGYCADGVSLGTVTTNIDPKAWRIIEGKLYINYDPGAADGFAKNPTKVVNSQKHWAEVQHTLVSEKLQADWRQNTAR
ncbi:YHS domain-containing (seleno)protein [Rhizobium herbae]|jgi:YHS domain-containing protein